MISQELLARVACPICLEPSGCSACRAPAGHDACGAYAVRAGCACGGPDKVRLQPTATALACPCCGSTYPMRTDAGYVDLVPHAALGERTHYADEEFQERLHVTEAPPVLSARIKIDMMRAMLQPKDGETLLDLGCGAGKFSLFVRSTGTPAVGLDVAPFFLGRVIREVDLVLGDLRRLPFRKGAFTGAYTLDVLEHLEEDGVRAVLLEARRTLAPGGRLFVYTHAMESSSIARFQRGVNHLARWLGRAGLIDYEREAMRKTDHRNAIRSHEHFDALCEGAGLVVARRRYYNVVFKAVIEDLLLRLWEQARRRASPKPPPPEASAPTADGGPRTVGGRLPSPAMLFAARLLTLLLRLDVALFGRIRTGPFFGLLVPRSGTAGATRE